jgi:hypothetical protein
VQASNAFFYSSNIKKRALTILLLQEHYTLQVLEENDIPRHAKFKIDHSTGTFQNGNIFELMFPNHMVELVTGLPELVPRAIDYVYIGVITSAKAWVTDYKDLPLCNVRESQRGRDKSVKFTLDIEYYKTMKQSRFALCPTDVYPWSYRFFEAIMCGCIPILADDEHDRYAYRFKVYRRSDTHVYRSDWVSENLSLLIEHHTMTKYWQALSWTRGHSFVDIKSKEHALSANSTLLFSRSNCMYLNAKVVCPEYDRDKWHGILASENNRIIQDSNTYTTAFHTYHERDHQIYDRLMFAYYKLCRDTVSPVETINEESFLMCNAFTGINTGHELSIILDAVKYIRGQPSIKRIYVLAAVHWYPNNYNLMLLLLPRRMIFELPFSSIFCFRKIHIIRQNCLDIMKHREIIKELRAAIPKRKVQPKKIILVKCSRNQQVVRTDTAFVCEKLISGLEKHGFVFVNPETTHIFDLCQMLQNASHIVCSWGGILYTNMMFFKPSAVIVLLRPESMQAGTFWKYALRLCNRLLVIPKANMNLDKYDDVTRRLILIIQTQFPNRTLSVRNRRLMLLSRQALQNLIY